MIKVGENQKVMNFYVYMKVDHLIPFFLMPCAHSNIFWLILNWKIIFIKKWGFHVYHIVYFSTMESNISNNIKQKNLFECLQSSHTEGNILKSQFAIEDEALKTLFERRKQTVPWNGHNSI